MNIAHNVTDLMTLAGSLAKSGLMPDGLNKPEAILAIALKGQELGIPPMAAIAGITVIRGKPIVSPQLMLSLVERSGKLQDWRIVEESDVGVTVEFTRKGRSPITKRFTMEDAKKMGLADKDNYRKQPRTMMQWRAIAAAIRLAFPDVIDGCYTPDEMGIEVEVEDDGGQTLKASLVPQEDRSVFPNPGSGGTNHQTLPMGSGGGPAALAFSPAPTGMSAASKKTLLELAEKCGYATKQGGKGMSLKDFIERMADRKISSFADVTEAEAQVCISELEHYLAAIEELGGKKIDGSVQKVVLQ